MKNRNNQLISIVLLAFLAVALPFRLDAVTQRGDVNHDGIVNISDVTLLINMLLTSTSLDGIDSASDVNDDGVVNISDTIVLINCILNDIELPFIEPQLKEFNVNGVYFVMTPVEGGTFEMGGTSEQGNDPIDREKPVHQVTLSSYYIGQTEVTQALWQAVMDVNPAYFNGGQLPVEQVSWEDCQEFITALNQLTGCVFRLPTEAEWEFAGSNDLPAVAWYSYNDSWQLRGSDYYGTHAVATRNPNELMLFDMSGNVHEWCQDWFGGYTAEDQVNPVGPTSGVTRVYRGGSWYFDEWFCRVSFRNGVSPGYRSYGIGLRLAL